MGTSLLSFAAEDNADAAVISFALVDGASKVCVCVGGGGGGGGGGWMDGQQGPGSSMTGKWMPRSAPAGQGHVTRETMIPIVCPATDYVCGHTASVCLDTPPMSGKTDRRVPLACLLFASAPFLPLLLLQVVPEVSREARGRSRRCQPDVRVRQNDPELRPSGAEAQGRRPGAAPVSPSRGPSTSSMVPIRNDTAVGPQQP